MMRNLLLLPLIPCPALACCARWADRKDESIRSQERADPLFTGMHALPIQAGQAFFWITPLLYNTDARVEGKKEGSACRWI